jgi:hypothetical protein
LFPVLVLISSRSVDELYDQCLTRWRNRPAVSRLFAAVVGAGVLTSICLLTPLTLAKQHLYTDHYNRVHAAVEEKVKGHQALVLLGRTVISPLDKHLLSRNDPFLENNVVYVSLEHPTTDIPALPGFLKNREIFTLEMCQPHQIVVDRYSLHTDTEPTSHE